MRGYAMRSASDLARLDAAAFERRPEALVAPHVEAHMTLAGDAWLIGFEGRELHVRAGKGMSLLARLLESPDQELGALALVSEGATERVATREDALLDARTLREGGAMVVTRAREIAGQLGDEAERSLHRAARQRAADRRMQLGVRQERIADRGDA